MHRNRHEKLLFIYIHKNSGHVIWFLFINSVNNGTKKKNSTLTHSVNYRIKKWLKRKNNKINPFKFTWKVNFLFYLTIQQHRWAYPEDSTPQSCQRANLLFFLEKNIYFGPHCYILHSRQKIKKKKTKRWNFYQPIEIFYFLLFSLLILGT